MEKSNSDSSESLSPDSSDSTNSSSDGGKRKNLEVKETDKEAEGKEAEGKERKQNGHTAICLKRLYSIEIHVLHPTHVFPFLYFPAFSTFTHKHLIAPPPGWMTISQFN
ncbi:unnamed protein product [Arctogadus glacialis]